MNYKIQAYTILYDVADENKKAHNAPFPFARAPDIIKAWKDKLQKGELRLPETKTELDLLRIIDKEGWIHKSNADVDGELVTLIIPMQSLRLLKENDSHE